MVQNCWNLNFEIFEISVLVKEFFNFIANLTAQSFKVFSANKKATCACSVFISAPLSLLFRSLCGTRWIKKSKLYPFSAPQQLRVRLLQRLLRRPMPVWAPVQRRAKSLPQWRRL